MKTLAAACTSAHRPASRHHPSATAKMRRPPSSSRKRDAGDAWGTRPPCMWSRRTGAWRRTIGKGTGCTIWTTHWTLSGASCLPSRTTQNLQRSKRYVSPTITSGRSPRPSELRTNAKPRQGTRRCSRLGSGASQMRQVPAVTLALGCPAPHPPLRPLHTALQTPAAPPHRKTMAFCRQIVCTATTTLCQVSSRKWAWSCYTIVAFGALGTNLTPLP